MMKILSLMFHSVGSNAFSSWRRNHLSVPVDAFETFCIYLKKNNYQSLFLNEWYDLEGTAGHSGSEYVVLTFDDGYLDNWVYVYPLLKKYGLKGTIFINPDFINRLSEDPRPQHTGKDFNAGNVENILGFLNWNEVQEMSRSGFIDIQSHSMTHDWYFCSNEIIDIYTGQDKYDWLPWIFKPERKPFYITEDQSNFVPYGYPVFRSGRSLSVQRYFPSQSLIDVSISRYDELRSTLDADKKMQLIKELNSLVSHENYAGHYESDEAMRDRYRYELLGSKKILEEKLNKKVDFLCWPGGAFNEMSYLAAAEAGYIAATHSESKKIHSDVKLKAIPRIGMGCSSKDGDKRIYLSSKHTLVNSLRAVEGRFLDKVKLRFSRLKAKYL